MSACGGTFGEGSFGIPQDETGLVTTGITFTSSSDKVELKNAVGNVVGLSLYNCRTEVQFEGVAKTSETFDWMIGTVVTLQNDMPDRIPGDTGGGSLIVDTITDTWGNEQYQQISATATYYPSIPSGA